MQISKEGHKVNGRIRAAHRTFPIIDKVRKAG